MLRRLSLQPFSTLPSLPAVQRLLGGSVGLGVASLPAARTRPRRARVSPTIQGVMEPLEVLIRRAQRGDRRALELVLSRHAKDATRIAHKLLGPSADLEDVVQEALFQVARSIASFEGHSKFSTWLFRVVANVVRMHLRKKASRPVLELSDPRLLGGYASSVEGSPERAAERKDDVRALYAHVDRLTEKKRTVLVLHDLAGVPGPEVAEMLQIPLLTVRTRLFYARKELYAALANDPELAHLARLFTEARGD